MRIEDATQTVGGHPVRIYATDGGSAQEMIHGAIWVAEGWQATTWSKRGKKFQGPPVDVRGEFDLDLRDWREDIPWSCLRDEIQEVCKACGRWWGYTAMGSLICEISGVKMPVNAPELKEAKRPKE
jgi:hypothetical protein